MTALSEFWFILNKRFIFLITAWGFLYLLSSKISIIILFLVYDFVFLILYLLLIWNIISKLTARRNIIFHFFYLLNEIWILKCILILLLNHLREVLIVFLFLIFLQILIIIFKIMWSLFLLFILALVNLLRLSFLEILILISVIIFLVTHFLSLNISNKNLKINFVIFLLFEF
jgi:hypothetical protein